MHIKIFLRTHLHPPPLQVPVELDQGSAGQWSEHTDEMIPALK